MPHGSPIDVPREVELTLASTPFAPRAARKAVADVRGHLDADVVTDLELVVSELVANSVRHGPGQPITITLRVEGARTVRGEVVDEGDPTAELAAGRDPARAHGLDIVDAVADAWGVRVGSTHVWFLLDRGD